MGSNCAPHLANIYLYVYESNYIQSLIESDDGDALSNLQHIFRFQDDCLAVNDNGLFGSIINDVYPSEMIINNTNISVSKCSYLDLLISVYQGKFRICLFDKRRDFRFSVISYPFLDGNVPKAQLHGLLISQLVRFSTVCSTYKVFLDESKKLILKLLSQAFNAASLRKRFFKFYSNYIYLWGKYGVDIIKDFNKIFDP